MPNKPTEYDHDIACNDYQLDVRRTLCDWLSVAAGSKYEIEVRIPHHGYVRGSIDELCLDGTNDDCFYLIDGSGGHHVYKVDGLLDISLNPTRIVLTHVGTRNCARRYMYAHNHPTIWRM